MSRGQRRRRSGEEKRWSCKKFGEIHITVAAFRKLVRDYSHLQWHVGAGGGVGDVQNSHFIIIAV